MSARPPPHPAATAALAGLAAANAGMLAILWRDGGWLLDPSGGPLAVDFALFRAAGQLAADGVAASVYDPVLLKGAEVAALGGRDFPGHYGWHYPPTFLLLVLPLSLLGWVPAQLAWLAATGAACLAVAGAIAGRAGVLLALALPPALACATVGQGGFLLAALFGGALLALPGRPILAGCLLGLLAAKPHLGILVPVALLAGGHWRAAFAAAAATLGLAGLSAALFGPETWAAFLRDIPLAGVGLLGEGIMGFGKLVSPFGVVRASGGSAGAAWIVQGAATAGAALATALLWRSAAPYRLKAAGLATATLLATPYLYLYDLVLLAMPIAFLARGALGQKDLALLGAAFAAGVAFPFVGGAAGLAAVLLVAAVTGRMAAPFLIARAPSDPAPTLDEPVTLRR